MATFSEVRKRLQHTQSEQQESAFGSIRSRFNQPETPRPADSPIRLTPELPDVMEQRGMRAPQEITMPNNVLPSQTVVDVIKQRAQESPVAPASPSQPEQEPAVRRVLRNVLPETHDYLRSTPMGAFINAGETLDQLGVLPRQVPQFFRGVESGATFGISEAQNKLLGRDQAVEDARSPVGQAGQIAGSLLPGAAIERGAAAVLRPVIRNLPRAAQFGITGGVAGALDAAGQEVGDVAFRDSEFNPESIAIGGGAGTVLGGAAPLIGAGLQRLIRTFRPQQAVPTPQGPVLALPEPQPRGNINRAETPDVINVPESGPRALPEPNVAPPTRARVERPTQQYQQRLEEFVRSMEGTQLPPGREREAFLEAWGRFAKPDEPDLETMIDLAYPSRPNRVAPDLVQRARETQRRREAYGVGMPVRTMADRYQGGVMGNAAMPETVAARNNLEPQIQQTAEPQNNLASPLRQQEEVMNIQTNPVQEVEEALQAVQQPRVRDRVYSYLDEAERAARERIASRRNRLSANPVDEWADYAVIMAAKLVKGSIKATDFTEELVREFGEQMRPHAQQVLRRTRELIRQQERRASREGQEAMEFNNSGRGDASTAESKISREAAEKKTPFRQRWEQIRTQFIDDLAPLEGLEKRVRGRLASAEDSLYKAARMFKGTPQRAAQLVETRLGPIVESVERAGHTADDLGLYAVAVHARDVNNAGYISGFTNAEIEDVIQKYGTKEMEAARQQLVQVNKDMMQELVDSGVVSRQLADTLDERWKNYIPMFRAFDDDMVEFEGGLSKALANVTSPIKALKGSERAVIDPLENMVKNIFQSVNAAERNKVATQLAKLAEIDADQQFIRRLEPDETVGRKNVVDVKVNGENVKYEVEPEVYKALLNLDQESSNMLINVLSKPASLLRAGATLTPEFSLRNPMRDILQAFVTSNSGFNPVTDFTAGLIQSISKGPLYRQWVEDLGAYGNILSMDRNVHRQALEKVLKEPPSKKFVNIVSGRSLINILRAISDTTESATKVGEYRAALRQGQSRAEAAYRSRDIMDFARAGTGIRQANRIVAFLNANIQGKSKLIRSIKENPAGTLSRMFVSTTVPTIGVYAINQAFANETQRQTIEDAPDWLRDTFWLLAIPGTDTVARIPKPFDIAPIFANLPERALDYVRTNDPASMDGFLRRTLSDMALPVQISGLLPFVEGMANYSFFRESNIIPMREQNLEYRDQYDPVRTTETARILARGAESLTGGEGMFRNFSSPRIMDNTIRGLTAGLGTYATSAIDAILRNTGAVDRPKAPQKRLEQQPLLGSFLVDRYGSTKSMDKFYEERERLQRQKSSASINNRPFRDEAKLKAFNHVASNISEINKQIRTVEASNLSAAEKRRRIEPLIESRNKMARDIVNRQPQR